MDDIHSPDSSYSPCSPGLQADLPQGRPPYATDRSEAVNA